MLREEREDLRLMRPNHGAVIAARHLDVLVGLHRDRLHRLRPCASDRDRHDGVHVAVDQHDWHLRDLAETLPIDGKGGGRERDGRGPPLRVLDRQVQRASATHRMAHQVRAVIVDLEFLAYEIDHLQGFLLTQLAQVGRIVRVVQQTGWKRSTSPLRRCRSRVGRRRRDCRRAVGRRDGRRGVGRLVRRRRRAAASPRRRSAVPAARVVSHRREQNVAASLRQVDRVRPHHRRVRSADPVQRHDHRRFLVFPDLRRHEQRVRDVLVHLGEMVHPDLDPGVDRLRSAAAPWGLRR